MSSEGPPAASGGDPTPAEPEPSPPVTSEDGESSAAAVSPEVPYLFVASFAEPKRQHVPRTPTQPRTHRTLSASHVSPLGRPRLQRTSTDPPPPKPQFLVQFPEPCKMEDDGSEVWSLRCVCEEKQGIGLLVQCEKCQNWQHAICVGLNERTIPEKYICEICGNRPIRCKCNNNINYRFALIQCTKCGYYVHRRCVGLLYGPMPRGDYVCTYCGKSKFTYAKVKLPSSVTLEDTTFTFSPEKLESIPSQLTGGPFTDFLTIDVAEATLTAREFCESFYDRFRSFFFLCHPLNPNSISRKKRHNLFVSFMTASEYLCKYLYNISEEKFREVFDAFLVADLYKPLTIVKDEEEVHGCTVSENTRFELSRLTNIVRAKEGMTSVAPHFTENGCFAPVDMKQDTFLGVVHGFIGDLEEFNYDNGVDLGWYQIADTRLILDATHIPNSPLHRMRRSMHGNCVLKIIDVGDQIVCGLFIGRALLTSQKSSEELIVRAGQPLTLGIDFIPAVLEDIGKFIGWHCSDLDEHNPNRPSRDERELQAAIRQCEGSKRAKQPKQKKKDGQGTPTKKTRGRKMKRKDSAAAELSLFELFDSESPCEYMFTVTEDVEQYKRRLAETALQQPRTEPKRQKSEQRKTTTHDRVLSAAASAPAILPASPARPAPSPIASPAPVAPPTPPPPQQPAQLLAQPPVPSPQSKVVVKRAVAFPARTVKPEPTVAVKPAEPEPKQEEKASEPLREATPPVEKPEPEEKPHVEERKPVTETKPQLKLELSPEKPSEPEKTEREQSEPIDFTEEFERLLNEAAKGIEFAPIDVPDPLAEMRRLLSGGA